MFKGLRIEIEKKQLDFPLRKPYPAFTLGEKKLSQWGQQYRAKNKMLRGNG